MTADPERDALYASLTWVTDDDDADIVDAIKRVFGALGSPNAKLPETLPAGFEGYLRGAWISHDRNSERASWLWLLRTLRNSGHDLMSPDMRKAHAALPPVVTIWRGLSLVDSELANIEAAARGTSWTTDREVAESYAWSRSSSGYRCLARAVVPREAIHSYFGDWHSHECIMDRPDEIEGIRAKRLPTPPPRLVDRSGLAALAGLGRIRLAA